MGRKCPGVGLIQLFLFLNTVSAWSRLGACKNMHSVHWPSFMHSARARECSSETCCLHYNQKSIIWGMKNKAYSYVRFSTKDQINGDSLRRQTKFLMRWSCSRASLRPG